ncbi:MAG: CPBP family intramembrane metalloprotease [Bacteroidaceae bacterium]|nr:CPBP family intramembrane metalloprotease [Bacteroidaceae bacterium]
MKREIANIIKYLIVYGVLLVFPVVIIAICEVVGNRLQGGTMNSDEVWETPFMTTGMMLGSMLIIACFLWKRWASLGLGRIKRSGVWMVVLMGVVLFLGWYFPEDFLMSVIDVPSDISDDEFSNMTGGVTGFIDSGILAPVAEEMLCRGAILTALLKMMPRKPYICILVQALIFGAIHMSPDQMVYGTLYGILLGWLCWRTRSLIPGIVVHVVNNSTVLLLPDSVDDGFNELSIAPKTAVLVVSLLVLSCGIYWFCRKYPTGEEQEHNTASLPS